jgi:polyhydroxybutyrate depolymerase
MGLWVSAMACGPSVVDLGARGRAVGDPGPDSSAADSGAAGASGEDATGLGGAGAGQGGAGEGGAGVAAVGGAGPPPPLGNDAGTAMPPDAAVPGLGPYPSTGCGMEPTTTEASITVGNSTARYIVDLAAGYDRNRPYPLVMSFRAANVSIAQFRRDLDLPAVVGADGIVVNMDCANGAGMWDLQRDPPVFEALLAKLEATYCIDRRRIFVVGHETGAIFANLVACTHAEVLRGLGSISGVEPRAVCTGALAVWISQGNADMTRMLGRADRDFWLRQNQCDQSAFTQVEPSPCLHYTACEIGAPVHYCEYNGNQNIPSFAAAALWDFFKAL